MNNEEQPEVTVELISNYEAVYWTVVADGMDRTRRGIWVAAGVIGSLALMFLDVCAAIYMIFPIVYYVAALYKRSQRTGHIFGFSKYPGYASLKLTIFVASVILYGCTSHGYLPIEVAYPPIAIMIAMYAIVMLYTGYISVFIKIKDLDAVFKMRFGAMTQEDIEGRRKIFGDQANKE